MTFEAILEQFLTSRRARGCSNKTLLWYRQQLTAYQNWLLESLQHQPWYQPETIEAFLAYEQEQSLSPSTVQARYRAIGALITWLIKRGLLVLETSPMALVERPTIPRRLADRVDLAEFNQLYRSIPNDNWLDCRDRLILLILFWSGLRLNELVTLQICDILIPDHIIIVRQGKGGKDRLVPCSPQLPPVLLDYLYQRPPWPDGALLLGSDGKEGVRQAMTGNGVRQMLRRRCRAVPMRYLHPHAWRHGFAVNFLNAGANLSSISTMLGHANTKTTEYFYAYWLTGSLQIEYERARLQMEMEQKKGLSDR